MPSVVYRGRHRSRQQVASARFCPFRGSDQCVEAIAGVPLAAEDVGFLALNSARHALTRLQEHLRVRPPRGPEDRLADYVAETYGDED
jgi:hypothetical protein